VFCWLSVGVVRDCGVCHLHMPIVWFFPLLLRYVELVSSGRSGVCCYCDAGFCLLGGVAVLTATERLGFCWAPLSVGYYATWCLVCGRPTCVWWFC